MSQVTTADITKLRKMTGAGMMDCKKALQEAEGDFDAAVDVLRKKGIAKAAKREDREAREGVVVAIVSADQTNGVIVSLNCETDFVARNEEFQGMVSKIAELALGTGGGDGGLGAAAAGDALASRRRRGRRSGGTTWR